LTFELPTLESPLTCFVGESEVFHPELAAKFPTLMLRSGVCEDGRSVSLSFQVDAEDSLSAFFSVPGSSDWLYVDNTAAGVNRYVIRRRSRLTRKNSDFSCNLRSGKASPSRSLQSTKVGRQLQEGCALATLLGMAANEISKSFMLQNLNQSNLIGVQSPFLCTGNEVGEDAPSRIVRFIAPVDGFYSFSTCNSPGFDSVLRLAVNSCTWWAECMDDPVTDILCAFEHVQVRAGDIVYAQIAGYAGRSLPAAFNLTISRVTLAARKLRMALVTNTAYSNTVGGTTTAVANAVAAIMARVNGIYWRELGVFFQLIPKNDLLFCSRSNAADFGGCSTTSLPNTRADIIISRIGPFIANRGIASSEYDIGHCFTTGSGGLAALRVACTSDKARGTTGQSVPFGDPFAVDYVSHELGHQLGAEHTFNDCEGKEDNEAPNSAVEPVSPCLCIQPRRRLTHLLQGSGSTIMSYAGICQGDTNIQGYADPYFHAVSLHDIRNHLLAQPKCGETLQNLTALNTSIDLPEMCAIPSGNYFQLQLNMSGDWFVQWDQIDPVPKENFSATDFARFRS
jgi:hypothetical protein